MNEQPLPEPLLILHTHEEAAHIVHHLSTHIYTSRGIQSGWDFSGYSYVRVYSLVSAMTKQKALITFDATASH